MADTSGLKTRQMMLQKRADLILDAAARRDPPGLSDDDKKEVNALTKEIDGIVDRIEGVEGDAEIVARVEQMTGGTRSRGLAGLDGLPPKGESWGTTFTKHPAIGEFLKAGHPSGGQWSSPHVDLHATAVLESTSPIVEPQYVQGVVSGPTGPIVMSQLFAPGTATSGLIVFMEETLATNAAAAVAEGGLKSESALAYAPVNEPLHKVATWLPVSDEMLTDVPQMQSTIDTRLRGFVLVKLDDELLSGSGVAPHMKGLLVRTDLTPPLAATGNGIDSIGAQIAAVEQASQLPVDGIVMNGADWLAMGLVKTSTGEYLSGSPFQQAGPKTLFGRQVAVTPAMPQGTALVGSFRSGGGQLFLHPAMRTAITNSHADFFVRNLLAILSEIRAALALYRPIAFGLVTGLNPPVVP